MRAPNATKIAIFSAFFMLLGSGVVMASQAVITVGSLQPTGYKIAFDGSYSTGRNPLGMSDDKFGIKKYTWDFGDGSPAVTGEYLNTTTYSYPKAGTYTVTLTVRDYNGVTDTTKTSVTVKDLPTVSVSGTTAAAVQAAIDSLGGSGIVLIPSGTYSLSSTVKIPAGVILKGAGAGKTILKNTSSTNRYILWVAGDNARITGLSVVGPGATNYGIVGLAKNLYIDNCDISGFQYATSVQSGGSATYEQNHIHHNITEGYGYGIMLTKGSYAMIRNNRFAHNRHSVATSGGTGTDANIGFDFLDNHSRYDSDAPAGQEVDTHPDTLGRIRVVGNLVEDMSYFVSLRDGWGEIRNNTLRNVSGYFVRISGNDLRNLHTSHNTFVNSTNRLWIEQGRDVYFNCRKVDSLMPSTSISMNWNDCLAPPNPPRVMTVE